ncbi:hypothetical protein ACP4OV_024410 [Aristida adscensionis]
MRKEIIIRMQLDSEKHRNKALKVAASVNGVMSVTVTGRGRDLLLVIGDGVDAGKLTRNLRKEVGEAEIVELRTLPPEPALAPPGTSGDIVATRSPYQRHHHATPGRVLPGGERVEFPVAGGGGGPWPGERSWLQAGYHARTPSPWHYQYPSPVAGEAGRGGYGYAGGGSSSSSSSYAREVARSHPANYSPMIARHDLRAVGHRSPRAACEGHDGRRHGRGDPNCCSIL